MTDRDAMRDAEKEAREIAHRWADDCMGAYHKAPMYHTKMCNGVTDAIVDLFAARDSASKAEIEKLEHQQNDLNVEANESLFEINQLRGDLALLQVELETIVKREAETVANAFILQSELDALRAGREGWKLVPVKPTLAMIEASKAAMKQYIDRAPEAERQELGRRGGVGVDIKHEIRYRAMLSAAPTPGEKP
ncbi:MAG: hypothetical protein Q7R45_08300 [Sulfuricaulis sp.]|nr:hypothetical protein [Sulfuricaulis sp.]